jgi:hypothetical protein
VRRCGTLLFCVLCLGLLVDAGAAQTGVPAFWRNLAQCETGGRWDWGKYAGTPSQRPAEGFTYEGGLGFYAGTWDTWRIEVNVRYDHAWQAPPAVQVRVARWGLAHGGYWGCLNR